MKFMSLEKAVFPFMAQDGQFFAFDLEGVSSVPIQLGFITKPYHYCSPNNIILSPLLNQYQDLDSMYSMYFTHEDWTLERVM